MGLVLLVRHGQASFGADDYDVLSENGWAQARALGSVLAEAGLQPRTVVHGGMRRQRETWAGMVEGGIVAGPGGAGKPVVDSDWDEFDFLAVLARWAEVTGTVVDHGVDRRTFQRTFETATTHWAAGEDEGYPDPYDAFLTRARSALDRVAALPGPAIVVTSGGVIAALAASLVLPPDAPSAALAPTWQRFNTVIANSSVSRVIAGSTGQRLLTFNEHTHLTGDLVTYR